MYADEGIDGSNVLEELKAVARKVNPMPRKKKVDELFKTNRTKICPRGHKVCRCKSEKHAGGTTREKQKRGASRK